MSKKNIDAKDLLIDWYARELDTVSACYEMMGRLLNEEYIKKYISFLNEKKIYIYGGGYIGIQFYKAVEKYVSVIAVVDKKGELLVDVPNIPVIDIVTLKKKYNNEIIFITPIKFYKEIYIELMEYIPKNKIILLGELWGM